MDANLFLMDLLAADWISAMLSFEDPDWSSKESIAEKYPLRLYPFPPKPCPLPEEEAH